MNEEDIHTARSYRAGVLDDNAIISINLKWLLQIIILSVSLVYGYYRIETRITNLENGVLSANAEIRSLLVKHELAEAESIKELQEELKFYQKLNPWKKK